MNKKRIGESVLVAALTLTALEMNYSDGGGDRYYRIVNSFGTRGIADAIFLAGLVLIVYFCIYRDPDREIRRSLKEGSIVVPSVLFAFFQSTGPSFECGNSWDLAFGGKLALARWLYVFAVLFIFFFLVIRKGFAVLDEYESRQEDEVRVMPEHKETVKKCLNKSAPAAFVMVLLVYLCFAAVFYPGLLTMDTVAYISEGFNEKTWTTRVIELADPSVRLTRWHSVTYILFQHMLIIPGLKLTGSANAGIFAVTVSQAVIASGAIAYAIKYMTGKGIKKKTIIVLLIYFGLNYRIINYVITNIKDTFYGFLFLVFIVSLTKVFVYRESRTVGDHVLIAASGAALCTLRNEAIYIMILSFIFIMVYNRKTKLWRSAAAIGAAIVLIIGAYNCVLDARNITGPSKGEMLSVPLQQTARYLRDYPEDVTAEEIKTIDAVADADSMPQKYDPGSADNVKFTYNIHASDDDLREFFKTWVNLLRKHPGVMIQATMNNYYDYFYISENKGGTFIDLGWSAKCMDRVNSDLGQYGLNLHYPGGSFITSFREMTENINLIVFELPVISLLNKAATYVWLFILWLAYIFRKKRRWLCIAVFFAVMMCIWLVGPTGGWYFRYVYPFAVCLPVLIPLSIRQGENDYRLPDEIDRD